MKRKEKKKMLWLVDPPVDSHFCSAAYNPSFVEQPQNFHFSNCFSSAYIVKDVAFLILMLTMSDLLMNQ